MNFANRPITFEWGVITFGVGIAAYFVWPTEPSWVWLALFMAAAWVTGQLLGTLPALIAILLTGMAWSAAHTMIVSPNPVETERRMTLLGWVADIDDGGPMRRLILRVEEADPVPASGLPETVRVRVGQAFGHIGIGDGIALDAVIAPLPGPVTPDGYDPARRAYFDGLSGSGFAISPPRTHALQLSWRDRQTVRLAKIRRNIADQVMADAPAKTAGLQAALLTGIRDHIPDAQTDSLRASGLAHILAISGLHMGMVSIGIFAAVTLMLATVEPLARSRDVRKIAACVGLIAATAYLGLSGASVATQRAYIMVCIAFLAVLLDRRVLSLRSVAVAAFLTLLIRPEALMSVGFQMSFSAVTAMVVIFRAWQDFRPPRKAVGMRDRIAAFYGSLFGTSLIAGLATGGYALLHFGRIAKYGLLANMAAMAVFPIVMALGILSLLLMPIGLDRLPLQLMGWTLSLMLSVSDWVSGLPGAVGSVKASQPHVIALYSLGFVLACFGRKLIMVSTGIGLMLMSFVTWVFAPTYDMRISETGRVSVIADGEGQTASLRADRYGRDQFARASGRLDLEWKNYRDAFAQCDVLACRMTIRDRIVTVVEAASEVPDACMDSDVVILPEGAAGPVARRGCQAQLIDVRTLRRSGSVYVSLKGAIRIVPVLTESRSRRPWGRRRD